MWHKWMNIQPIFDSLIVTKVIMWRKCDKILSNEKCRFLKYILLIMLLHLSGFFLPFIPHCPVCLPLPWAFSHLISCSWVIHISSLASPFPILFFTSLLSILFLTIMLLIPCTFAPILPPPYPADNPPCDLHFCDSLPVLVVCLVCFCFLGLVVDSCHFTLHVFDLLLFLR